jgi:excisionase family DNA binding protein
MDNNHPSLTAFPVFLSIPQIREILGISQSSVLRHIKSGALPHVKLGRRVLIPREAIETLIDKSGCLPVTPVNE